MNNDVKNSFDWHIFLRLLKLARPYRLLFIGALVLAIVVAPFKMVRPFLINKMVDDYIVISDLEGMRTMLLWLFIVLFIEVILQYVFIYSTNLLGQSVIKDLRMRVFKQITKLNLTYFDKTPIGTSTTRTISDVQAINEVFSQGVITVVADILTIFYVIIMMVLMSWKLAIVCLTTLPIMLFITYIFKEKVKVSYQLVRTKISQMNAFLQERISGMRIVQIFNAEAQELEKFKKINYNYTGANLKSILYYSLFFPAVETVSALALGLMVWYGARGVLNDTVSLGALIVFPLYLSMLFRPLRFLADRFNQIQMGLVAANRIFNLLDRDTFIRDTGTVDAKKLRGDIIFKDVEFSYVQDTPVLKKVSFNLKEKETLAVIGSTGSGKSTIINILNRFYEYQDGQISIDGVELRDYKLSALRSRMALVLQDVFLFSGSVYENITLRNKDITRQKVMESAKMIGAHKFIMQLPGGYDYQVRERGATLSMGQRQLISFVRALAFDPDILILDEATSSIDPESEAVIQYAIQKLIAKRTSIIIAHRLSTIRHANNILVLSKGKVVEYGPHEELLARDGHYKQLYELQFLAETT